MGRFFVAITEFLLTSKQFYYAILNKEKTKLHVDVTEKICYPKSDVTDVTFRITSVQSHQIEKAGKIMSNHPEFKNRDRFIQLGIFISTYRKLQGLSQEKLAAKAHISRSLSAIESPNIAAHFSLEVLFNLADALEIKPNDLIRHADSFPPSSG